MKKQRLTKITVKTREIISLSKNAADKMNTSVCPICYTPFFASLTAAESSAVPSHIEKRMTTLSPAKISDDQLITK